MTKQDKEIKQLKEMLTAKDIKRGGFLEMVIVDRLDTLIKEQYFNKLDK